MATTSPTEASESAVCNLYNRLFEGADPDRPLFRRPGRETLSYGLALSEIDRLGGILAGVGIRPGMRVALCVEKSVAGVLVYLAVVGLGAIFVPLNHDYTASELDYMLGDCDPALLICSGAVEGRLELVLARRAIPVLRLDGDGEGSLYMVAPAPVEQCVTRVDDVAAILYTSGTTGRPKGAMITHGNLISNAEALIDAWHFEPGDILIHALPIFHAHGLFVGINVAVLAKASMIFLPGFDVASVLEHLPHATCFMGVPTFYARLLAEAGLNHEAASRIRLFISGSAPLSAEAHIAWTARTGHEILERYGMTETGMNTSNPYEGPRVPGSVGRALPDVTVRICAEGERSDAGPGEIGMVHIKGPNVFKGYWRQQARTDAEMTADGFFVTGDLGYRDASGFIHLVGRSRELIISGGYNVYPAEVEHAVNGIPAVLESAVVGLPHDDFGEGVTAVVVRYPDSDITEEQIRQAIRGNLAGYKLPKRILFVNELPRNALGKIQKGIIQEIYRDLYNK